MAPVILLRFFETAGRIAVEASEQARIVHSYVLADNASACFALRRILFAADFDAEGMFDVLIVNALAVLHSRMIPIQRLSATEEFHALAMGFFCHELH